MNWEYAYEQRSEWQGIDVMNEMGLDGWECFKVKPHEHYISGNQKVTVSMWFKRPIE